MKGRLRKQKEKNEKRIQEYRKLLQDSMELQRNIANNEKNNDPNKKNSQENTKKPKPIDLKTVNEDVKIIGQDLKSQSMQLHKLIKEFDQTNAIFKKKKTIRELDSSLSLYGINDTLMWKLDECSLNEYLSTLYKISHNLSESNQLRDLLTLVLHEVTNCSDQIQ